MSIVKSSWVAFIPYMNGYLADKNNAIIIEMRIATIGLGLIGGSISLALKRANWRDAKIIGFARNPEAGRIALEIGAVDEIESSLVATVIDADIVIVATPVLTIETIFSQIASHLTPGCIVIDTASTKLQVMQWAQELLPADINFIGGHPMAGKETFGIKNAQADLFYNCAYCLIKESRATSTAMGTIIDMVQKLGANPLPIDAQGHDTLVAGISHLPLLLSVALVLATTQDSSWGQMSQLASSGYRDLTRLAAGNADVNMQICLSNRSAIVSWIDKFNGELQKLRKSIIQDDNDILNMLNVASEARKRWQEERY